MEKCDLPEHCIWISFFHLFPHQTWYTLRLCEILVLDSSRGILNRDSIICIAKVN